MKGGNLIMNNHTATFLGIGLGALGMFLSLFFSGVDFSKQEEPAKAKWNITINGVTHRFDDEQNYIDTIR